jgi:hypothetical protein
MAAYPAMNALSAAWADLALVAERQVAGESIKAFVGPRGAVASAPACMHSPAPSTTGGSVDGEQRAGVARQHRPDQAELEAFATARVSRAMRLAVIAAARAGSAVPAVANAPSYSTINASASASESDTPVSAAS